MKIASCAFAMLFLYPIYSNGQVQNNGNLRMHAGSSVGLFGDFKNSGTFTDNLGTLQVAGSNAQTFSGTSPIHANNFNIDKAGNSLQLDNVLQIAGVLTFTRGMILSDHGDIASEFVDFLDGATYAGASDTSHVNGVVRKSGNDVFVFPTGDNSILRTIGISAPSVITDHFTAYYTENNPNGLYSGTSLDLSLDHVSACEYWMLNRTSGTSDVEVTLSWASNSCGVDNLCDLAVAQWDGDKWISAGNGGVTGTVESGTLVSGTGCFVPVSVTDFSPFTLGSISRVNPLPITLISFEAKVCGNRVCLLWQTASEINNDFFTVGRSADVSIWHDFENIDGAGNSNTILSYSTVDDFPFSGLSYYRLKQTDFDGEFEYSPVVSVYLENPNDRSLNIYPNPSIDNITVKGVPPDVDYVKIYNLLSQEVSFFVEIIRSDESNLKLGISLLEPGLYRLVVNDKHGSFIKL